jgi:GH24 family phage-related lysozyme (muramidase)
MSRKKLLDYLTELIVEGPFNWALSDMKDPKTGLPIMPPGKGDLKTLYSKDLTSGDYLTSTKTIVGKAPVGSSSAYNTTCSASLFDQTWTIILAHEGMVDTPMWDVDNWRIGHGSSTITKEDGTVIVLPNYGSAPDLTKPEYGGFESGKITLEDADRDLKRRINEDFLPAAKKRINSAVIDSVPDSVIAVLTSLCYNYGGASTTLNPIFDAVNQEDYCLAADLTEALSANKSRRIQEAKWMRECSCNASVNSSGDNTTLSSDPFENLIIGDSYCLFIDNASKKATRLNTGIAGAKEYLWLGARGTEWLKDALEVYPVTPTVKHVVVSMGTNDMYSSNTDVSGLVSQIKKTFPNCKIIVVPGSWNFNGSGVTAGKRFLPYDEKNKNLINSYYAKFTNLGAVLTSPVGDAQVCCSGDAHGNFPIYQKIGSEIDSIIEGNES